MADELSRCTKDRTESKFNSEKTGKAMKIKNGKDTSPIEMKSVSGHLLMGKLKKRGETN